MNGLYFDGATSKAIPIVLDYGPGYLHIRYTDSLGNAISRQIPAKNIHNWIIAGSNTIIKIGSFPHQSIQINGILVKEAVDVIPSESPEPVYKETFNYSSNKAYSLLLTLFLGMAAFVVALYVWVIPWVAVQIALSSPPSVDKSIGAAGMEQYAQFLPENKKASELAQEFMNTMKLDTSNFQPKVRVVDENIVNAFAMPGGNMVFYTGLINKMESPEELAGVMGHEWGHVTKRHTLQQLVASTSAYLVVSTLVGDVGGLTAILVQNADKITRLSYSRNMESESDEYALDVLIKSNLNPAGVSNAFIRLKESHAKDTTAADSTDEFEIPEFLTTHPDIDKRIDKANKLIKEKKFIVKENLALKEIFEELKALSAE